MSVIEDRAIVLRGWKLGETDRIVSLLCENSGKVRAVAKGVRKSTSKFGGRLEPFSECRVSLWKGRGELLTISQVDTERSNVGLSEDLDKLVKASAIAELLDKIAVEAVDTSALYALTSRAFGNLASDNSVNFLSAYFLRVATIEGVTPECEACIECGSTADLTYFDANGGGVRCQVHPSGAMLTPGALELLRLGIQGRIAELLARSEHQAAMELEGIVVSYLRSSFGVDLRVLRANLH
ncbi:MAG: DNA repair protein RecO [Acidimicrobiales bacterium]